MTIINIILTFMKNIMKKEMKMEVKIIINSTLLINYQSYLVRP